jgi:hypothetical protein
VQGPEFKHWYCPKIKRIKEKEQVKKKYLGEGGFKQCIHMQVNVKMIKKEKKRQYLSFLLKAFS